MKLKSNSHFFFLPLTVLCLIIFFYIYQSPVMGSGYIIGLERYFSPGSSYWSSESLFSQKNTIFFSLKYFLYIFLTIFSGKSIVDFFFGVELRKSHFLNKNLTNILKYALFFLPGYLVTVALSRICTILFKEPYAIGFIFLGLLLLAIPSLTQLSLKKIKSNMKNSIIFILLIFVFLIIQVQSPGLHITGDAVGTILKELASAKVFSNGERLPLFAKHYDEFLYLYPFLKGVLLEKKDLFFLWWGIGALGKFSIFSIVFFSLKNFIDEEKTIFIIIFFLFWGNHFLNPKDVDLLFDSGNPLGDVMHIGRGITSSLIFLCIFVQRYFHAENIKSAKTALYIVLLSFGLSSLSIHIALFYPVLVFMNFKADRCQREVGFFEKYILKSLPYLIVLSPVFFYFSKEIFIKITPFTMICIIGLLGYLLLKNGLTFHKLEKKYTKLFFISLASFILASLLLGNVLSPIFYSKLQFIKINFIGSGIAQSMVSSNIIGANKMCEIWPISHCFSPIAFYKNYAILLFLSSYALLILSQSKLNTASLEFKNNSENSFFLLGSLCLFFGALFIFDFTNTSVSHWLYIWFKSRLLEVSYYFIIALSLIILYSQKKIIFNLFFSFFILNFFAFEFLFLKNSRLILLYENFFYIVRMLTLS